LISPTARDRFGRRFERLLPGPSPGGGGDRPQFPTMQRKLYGVDVEDLAHAQLAHFADLIGSRLVVHGPRLRLKPASAQAIGLALHELATNAGKYGALSIDLGRVDVSWCIVRDTFTMSWAERDGPPVSAPKQRGFGAIVIEAMAERSVDGTVALNYAPSGLTWRLTCPAANALECEAQDASKQLDMKCIG
jgi:two-component sensor histidine kinase